MLIALSSSSRSSSAADLHPPHCPTGVSSRVTAARRYCQRRARVALPVATRVRQIEIALRQPVLAGDHARVSVKKIFDDARQALRLGMRHSERFAISSGERRKLPMPPLLAAESVPACAVRCAKYRKKPPLRRSNDRSGRSRSSLKGCQLPGSVNRLSCAPQAAGAGCRTSLVPPVGRWRQRTPDFCEPVAPAREKRAQRDQPRERHANLLQHFTAAHESAKSRRPDSSVRGKMRGICAATPFLRGDGLVAQFQLRTGSEQGSRPPLEARPQAIRIHRRAQKASKSTSGSPRNFACSTHDPEEYRLARGCCSASCRAAAYQYPFVRVAQAQSWGVTRKELASSCKFGVGAMICGSGKR